MFHPARSSDDVAGNLAEDIKQSAAQPCPSCRHVTFQLPNEKAPPPPPPRCLSATALEQAQVALRAQRRQLDDLEAVRTLSPPRAPTLPPSPPTPPATPPPDVEAVGRRLEDARRQLEAVRSALEAAPVLSCRSVATSTSSASEALPPASPSLRASKRVQASPPRQRKAPPPTRKPQKSEKNETSSLRKTSSSQTDVPQVLPRGSGRVSAPGSRVRDAVLRASEQVSASRASVGTLRALLMHRPKQQQQQQQQHQQQRQGRLQHQPHCKYYQGEPPANAAVFDVRSRQDEAEAEARRSRLQLQRLPALTIRRQLQVQWGPTVSLPQPGESPPPGPTPGHNVRLFEVRHGDARHAASAHSTKTAPTFGQTFVVQKQGETDIQRQPSPLTRPLKPVDVSPLRELPPKQPPTQAPPQPSPPVPPSTTPLSPSPSQRRSPPHQQTSRVKTSSRGKSGRHATTEMTRGRPLAVTSFMPSHQTQKNVRENDC